MNSHDKNKYSFFDNWLKINLFLVFSIIIVGGLTRLTDSGLSITEWELFSGILPPLTQSSWDNYFNLYKEIPQYKLLNNNMSLKEFKVIFYWEYIHRILARIIGLFFLIPLLYFYYKKTVNSEKLNICFLQIKEKQLTNFCRDFQFRGCKGVRILESCRSRRMMEDEY